MTNIMHWLNVFMGLTEDPFRAIWEDLYLNCKVGTHYISFMVIEILLHGNVRVYEKLKLFYCLSGLLSMGSQ